MQIQSNNLTKSNKSSRLMKRPLQRPFFRTSTPFPARKSSRRLEKTLEFQRIFSCQPHPPAAQTPAAMNKAELIESIQAALGKDATKRAADEALEAVLSSIAKGVKKDKKVQIIGFGTFEVKKRAARTGRNPKTGESMKIAASKSVGFKPSSVLKSSL
jgi:DNA-binding protein HU-beta